jgi:hypothetical protein
MKKFFQKLLATVVKKFIKKSVNDVVNNPEMVPDVPEVEPITLPGENSSKPPYERNPDFTGSSANMIF